VPTTPRGIVQLFKRLQQGEVVAVLPDQVPESGVFVPFFEQAALTDRLAHRLVQKTGASVVMMGLLRNEVGCFDLHLVPIEGLSNPDEAEALTDLNFAISQFIERAPAQYQWEYKRFKRHPDGGRDPYLKG
jgi:KDO2-lipid IV(A) lauroyltransferase